jgi:UDPglucose 6-dehydrogenase
MMKKNKVSVIGLGFVGLTLAIVNAMKDFQTIGIDIDSKKVINANQGKSNFYEPKLEKYLRKSLNSNKISFSENLKDILKTDITFLTVGTPSTKTGEIDLSQLKNVLKNIKKILSQKKTHHLIVVKSSVVPTTTSKIIVPYLQKLKHVDVVVNPEFLREGNAINDLLNPHLIVIGKNKVSSNKLEKYYKIFYEKTPEILITDLTSAEMIKYSNNAFLATKISFINSIANICKHLPNVDVKKISYAIGKDKRIGPEFLNAGPGFGGSCLPKDLKALVDFSDKFGNVNNLLKAVLEINNSQSKEVLMMIDEIGGFRANGIISILGLSFKKNTDDVRESVSIKIVRELLKKSIKIKVHDPMALENFKNIFGDKIIYCSTINDCIKNSTCCLILTEWDEYKKISQEEIKKLMKIPNVIDTRRVLEPIKFNKINFQAIGLGNFLQ